MDSEILQGLRPCSPERVSRVSSALTACGEARRGWDGPLALPSELISCQRLPRETARARCESQPPQLCLCITQDHIMHTDHCEREENRTHLNRMARDSSFSASHSFQHIKRELNMKRWYCGWLTCMSMIYYNGAASLIHMQITSCHLELHYSCWEKPPNLHLLILMTV